MLVHAFQKAGLFSEIRKVIQKVLRVLNWWLKYKKKLKLYGKHLSTPIWLYRESAIDKYQKIL